MIAAPQQSGFLKQFQQPSSAPQGIAPGETNPNAPSQPPQQAPQQQQLSREDYRDKWMSSGVKDQAGLTNFLNQYGGTQLSGNGTVKTPYGDDVIDMLIGARSGGNGMPGWTGLPGMNQSQVTPWNPNQQQTGGAVGGGYMGGQNTGINGGGFGGGGGNWLQQMLQQFQQSGMSSQAAPGEKPLGYNEQRNNPMTGGPQGPLSTYFQGGGRFGQQPLMPWNNGQATDQGPGAWGGQNNQMPMSPGGMQYNPYGPGGSSDNRTGPAGNYDTGPSMSFEQAMGGRQMPWARSGGSGLFDRNQPMYRAGNPNRNMPQ